jgi:hypothetical protein
MISTFVLTDRLDRLSGNVDMTGKSYDLSIQSFAASSPQLPAPTGLKANPGNKHVALIGNAVTETNRQGKALRYPTCGNSCYPHQVLNFGKCRL